MMRFSPPRIALAATLSLASCTGVVDSPSGPGGQNGQNGGDGNGNGNGNVGGANGEGESPAGLGTGVFALCGDGDKEQPGPRLLRLLTRREYKNTVRDLLFIAEPDVSTLPVESRVKGFDDIASAAAVTSRHIDEYLSVGEKAAQEAVAQHKSELLPCDPSASDCARTFVERFGERAMRRPLASDEIDRYAALFASDLTGGDFDEGMRLSITAMLVSPSFLYRSEVGEPKGDGTFALTQYEIASALSYLYWGTMPDATLFEAAAQGSLNTKEALEAEAQRMLEDPRAREQLGEFSLQWMRSDNLIGANKDKSIYPNFSDALQSAMIREQKEFVAQVVLDQNGTYEDLFLSDFVVANAELAQFYGLSAQGSDFAAIDVDQNSGRGGLLSMGAVLAAHAHANESSPIKRGLFVRDRVLCQTMPAPPKDVDATPPGLDPTLTTRERFAEHTNNAACAGCHKFIDGVGFGFEGFDGVGGRRTVENGKPIDESGNIVGIEGLDKTDSEAFNGPRDLAKLVTDSPSAQACLSLQYFRFARGYEERKSDACSLASLQKRFEAGNLTVKDLLVALPTLESFVVRKD